MDLSPDSPIDELARLTQVQRSALSKLGLTTIRDILYHIPHRYESAADIRTIEQSKVGETVTIYGQFSRLEMKRSFKTKVPMAEGTFTDGTGVLRIVWFHQPYVAKMIPTESLVRLRGTIAASSNKKYIANPLVERAQGIPVLTNDTTLIPIYPESSGVTSLWFYHIFQKILDSGVVTQIVDPLPPQTIDKYHLPSLDTALHFAHRPKNDKDAEVARKRFAFEEVFLIQVARGIEREKNKERRSLPIDANEERVAEFVKTFPFSPTKGQTRAIGEVLANFLEPYPMARLLEGDVGSGKTAVAAATAYAVVTSRPLGQKDFGNLQVAYLCPTEILAKQHFSTFASFFKKFPIQIGLITSSGCYKFPSKVNPNEPTAISRSQLLKWVANGEIPILIGTHALIEKSVRFKHLAYVIIDEQHRFGTFQRKAVASKGGVQPHLLSMTATPIPRTLALTVYGDLDLTVLDELPAGRKEIKTEIAGPKDRARAYEKVRELLKEGRQAYVICPRIDEPDPTKQLALQARSVAAELKSLKRIFSEFEIEKMHSKMTPNEKEDVMDRFEKGTVHILVSTSVVEVGVNVPNATIILIEGAERFGLAQLHQLRGRVMRSSYQPYCFLMVDKATALNNERLKAVKTAKNGFELAERDLELRGAGELYGRRQWGLSDIGMEALKNLKLVEAARAEALALVRDDPTLAHFPLLKSLAGDKIKDLHFE